VIGQVVAWFADPANWTGATGIPVRLVEHLLIAFSAILVAALIALPIGLYIGHTGRLAVVAINTANIGRAVPSFALMVAILPLSLALAPVFGYPPEVGLRLIPIFLAMLLLAIPPILVAAYAGLRAVDRDLIEAGRGMGMTGRQILRRLELPLAISVIVGGFRTATLQVIATATIGAVLAYGGLGRFIVDGLARSEPERLFAGAILVALLALGVDAVLAVVQRLLTPKALRQKVEHGRAMTEAIDPLLEAPRRTDAAV
jgi:osmoprotectant transport system permease protein